MRKSTTAAAAATSTITTPKAIAPGEEAAELVQYQGIASQLDMLTALIAGTREHVAALIAAEQTEAPAVDDAAEAAEESLEAARLMLILGLTDQMHGAAYGLQRIASGCLYALRDKNAAAAHDVDVVDDELRATAGAIERLVAAWKGQKAGARHSAGDMKLLQEAHDKIAALGAACAKADDAGDDDKDDEDDATAAAAIAGTKADDGEERFELVDDDDAVDDDVERAVLDGITPEEARAIIAKEIRDSIAEAQGRIVDPV